MFLKTIRRVRAKKITIEVKKCEGEESWKYKILKSWKKMQGGRGLVDMFKCRTDLHKKTNETGGWGGGGKGRVFLSVLFFQPRQTTFKHSH